MSKTMEFKVFCLEIYKQVHKLNGKESVDIFKTYGVFDYITSFYDILHSTGKQYIVEDIDIYINARR